jgi:hypothetical protein
MPQTDFAAMRARRIATCLTEGHVDDKVAISMSADSGEDGAAEFALDLDPQIMVWAKDARLDEAMA